MAENHRPVASSYSIVTNKDLSKGQVFYSDKRRSRLRSAKLFGCERAGVGVEGGEQAIVSCRHERQVVVGDRRIGGKEI